MLIGIIKVLLYECSRNIKIESPKKSEYDFSWGNKTKTKLSGFSLGQHFENLRLLGVYFGFTRNLLLGSTLCTDHLTACNSCPFYFPNTHVASAFRSIILIEIYFLCPLSVYLWFTQG